MKRETKVATLCVGYNIYICTSYTSEHDNCIQPLTGARTNRNPVRSLSLFLSVYMSLSLSIYLHPRLVRREYIYVLCSGQFVLLLRSTIFSANPRARWGIIPVTTQSRHCSFIRASYTAHALPICELIL